MAQIRDWGDGAFTEGEKAAIGYAERLFIDHGNIDQECYDDLLAHFSEEQIVELSWAIVSYMGFGRLIHAFGLRPSP